MFLHFKIMIFKSFICFLFLIVTICKICCGSLEKSVPHWTMQSNLTDNTFLNSLDYNDVANISCEQLQRNFETASVQYSECAVKYAQPIKICSYCVKTYSSVLSTYNDFQNSSLNCHDKFFPSNSLSIVNMMYNSFIGIWNTAHCDGCYSDAHNVVNYSDVSANVQKFFKAYNNTIWCLNSTIELNQNMTCRKCNASYQHLESCYATIPKYSSKVCADVEDAMNYTHRLWGNYGCKPLYNTEKFGVSNIIITTLLVFLPISFYIIALISSSTEIINIVQPKRRVSSPKE